jgi:hypothetical protein
MVVVYRVCQNKGLKEFFAPADAKRNNNEMVYLSIIL